MQMGGFSRASLIEQLTSTSGNGFTEAQAEYAATRSVSSHPHKPAGSSVQGSAGEPGRPTLRAMLCMTLPSLKGAMGTPVIPGPGAQVPRVAPDRVQAECGFDFLGGHVGVHAVAFGVIGVAFKSTHGKTREHEGRVQLLPDLQVDHLPAEGLLDHA